MILTKVNSNPPSNIDGLKAEIYHIFESYFFIDFYGRIMYMSLGHIHNPSATFPLLSPQQKNT